MSDTKPPAAQAIRTSIVRWFAVSTAMWVITTLLILIQTGAPVTPVSLLWLPVIAGLVAFSAATVRRAAAQLDGLDDQRDDLRDAYDRARVDALVDGMTGLGNHRAFQEHLDRLGASAAWETEAEPPSFALLVVDVDDLKRVNAAHGHAAGDELLQAAARIITTNLRRRDRGFRIGGDEFAAVLYGSGPEDAVSIARRILSSALSGGSGTLGVAPFSLTVGVSAMPVLAKDRKQLVHQAEAALYWGKRHGRTDVQVFDPSRHGIADDTRPLHELAAAVSLVATNRLLKPVYQPIHCLRTGRVLGYEGLVRPRPDAGFATASALFIAAEATDRTVELDLASLDTVLAGARSLDPDLYLSVNLSPRSLESDSFKPHEVLALARRRDIDPSRIVLELTEREAVEDLDRLRSALSMLRDHGVRIAADDVGAGNAGLRLLQELSFDIMKIDLSLVQAGTRDDSSEAVLRALRGLARQRGQTIVAEGVETPDQLLAVIELGFDAAQGYLLRRPGPALDAPRLDLARLAFPPEVTTPPIRVDQPASA